jgi:phosphatidylserine/phosphatidylglycerophosphate/cardiolipin synthase-like enzyme
LAAAGVPIWIDDQARIAHAKTMVIDGAVTLMGSMNWTRGAAANSEDVNLVSSPAVAAGYAVHWHKRLAVSTPFNRREDWCRRQTSLPMVYRVGSVT